MATVILNVWVNGVKTPYHITVIRFTKLFKELTSADLKNVLVQYYGKAHFGRNVVYTMRNTPQKCGKNSFLVDFESCPYFSLDSVRQHMFQYASGMGLVDQQRYPATGGLPPQHINSNGNPINFRQGITFTIEVI